MSSHTDRTPLVSPVAEDGVCSTGLVETNDSEGGEGEGDSSPAVYRQCVDTDAASVTSVEMTRAGDDKDKGDDEDNGDEDNDEDKADDRRPVFTISRGVLARQMSSCSQYSLPESGTPRYSQTGDSLANFAMSMEEYTQFAGLDETALIQAVVFIEDAYKYRSINHKVDEDCLRLYRRYYSTFVHVFRWVVIFVLHILAFFEAPSSLSWTSDMRYRRPGLDSPCWLMETIELTCLLLLLLDDATRGYLMGRYYFWQHKWDMGAVVLLLFSIADWALSAALGCTEVVRVRRMLRPFFIVQNSSLMKKTVHCLGRTLPEVFSVLIMLAMHLYIFSLFAMLLFPIPQNSVRRRANHSGHLEALTGHGIVSTEAPMVTLDSEGDQYFSSVLDSFVSFLVLLTTANNPDVTMPAYSRNRLFFLFFMLFLVIGLYCFWNMLTAVIYNQFRGYFLSSMQSSLKRRRLGVRASFEVLRRRTGLRSHCSPISPGVGGYVIRSMVEQVQLPQALKSALEEKVRENLEMVYSATDFQNVFLTMDMQVKPPKEVGVRWFQRPLARRLQKVIVHKYFSFFGIFVAVCNVVIISVALTVEFAKSFDDSGSELRVANFVFANYYVVEQLLKVWAGGVRRYVYFKFNLFEALITLALVVCEIYSTVTFGLPFFYGKHHQSNGHSIKQLWNILRIINVLIMLRLLKVIPYIKSMQVISSVLVDLVSNMKAFAGILIVIYYVFAILGMEVFQGVIQFNNATDSNHTYDCGSYKQLQYWANNFDDFAASLVVLWDVMVVNNWMVFLHAYRTATSAWSYLYFVAWWMISVIIVLNLFTALIMENFIMKWDRSQQVHTTRDEAFSQPININTVHDLFRGMLEEPADNELMKELCHHRHLKLTR